MSNETVENRENLIKQKKEHVCVYCIHVYDMHMYVHAWATSRNVEGYRRIFPPTKTNDQIMLPRQKLSNNIYMDMVNAATQTLSSWQVGSYWKNKIVLEYSF